MTPNLPMVITNKPSISLISRYGSPEHVLKVQQSILDLLLFGVCILPEDSKLDAVFIKLKEKMKEQFR